MMMMIIIMIMMTATVAKVDFRLTRSLACHFVVLVGKLKVNGGGAVRLHVFGAEFHETY
jgi:hypothetical protein